MKISNRINNNQLILVTILNSWRAIYFSYYQQNQRFLNTYLNMRHYSLNVINNRICSFLIFFKML